MLNMVFVWVVKVSKKSGRKKKTIILVNCIPDGMLV